MNRLHYKKGKPLLPIGINMDFLDTVFMDPPLTGTMNPLYTVIAINSKAQSTFVIGVFLCLYMEVEVYEASVTTIYWRDRFMDFFSLKRFDFVFCCFLFLKRCSFFSFFFFSNSSFSFSFCSQSCFFFLFFNCCFASFLQTLRLAFSTSQHSCRACHCR